jgi:predicted XRE-type DNA-binding protein
MTIHGLSANYAAVFQEMECMGEEEASLMLRTQLLLAVKQEISRKHWSQREAAAFLKVAQPRISEIQRLRIDKFSVELLLRYLDRLGKQAAFVIQNKQRH